MTDASRPITPSQLPDDVRKFSFRVWTYKMGEQVSQLIHLGDRLGLYRAMRDQGPMTSRQLAAAVDCHERFIREWLLGQAAAGLIDRREPEGSGDPTYELTAAQATVLADEAASLAFAAGAFRGGPAPEVMERIVNAFRTGNGLTYEQQGKEAAAGLARMTGPWSRLALTSIILPGLDGVVAKLEAGATVVDVGCGGGVTLATIATAFPKARCIGYDPSAAAIGIARDLVAERGLDNVEFVAASGAELPADGAADLVLTFDCLHDMARPDLAAQAIRDAIADDGTWLIKDIRSSGDFERDRRNPLLAMFYGFSVMSCLQSAMSEPDGLGLGTLGLHPGVVDDLVRTAGFSQITTHDFDDAANLYYEVRV